MRYCAFAFVCLFLFSACSQDQTDSEEKYSQQALAFAEAYFNYDYKEASKLVTPESRKWLSFAASNITQEDIDLINAQDGATVTVSDFTYYNDSTAMVTLDVENFVRKDTLFRSASVIEKDRFRLEVVRRDREYLVKMEGLPQSERQNRD